MFIIVCVGSLVWQFALFCVIIIKPAWIQEVTFSLDEINPDYLYYKRVDPYIRSAKAPVLEGYGGRRLYPLKGTSVDHVYVVFVAHVDRRIVYYSSKTDSWLEYVRWM